MKARVWISRQARSQALQARPWWRENRPSAPGLFAQELAVVQSLLATAPELGRPYHESSIPSLRRLLMKQTRYHVYYVYEAQRGEVVVLAIWSAVCGRAPKLRVL